MGAISFRWKLNKSPGVVDFVRENFVCAAADITTFERRQDTEGEFFRVFRASANELYKDKHRDQGIYVCDPAGRCYARLQRHDFDPAKLANLKELRAKVRPAETGIEKAGRPDPTYWATPPDGAQLVRIDAADGIGYRRADYQRDTLWILKDEARDLAAGRLPDRLLKRIVRFHALRLYTGSPVPWQTHEIQGFETSLQSGTVRVSFHAERKPKGQGDVVSLRGSLLGYVEAKDGKLTRFDAALKASRLDLYMGKRKPEVEQVMSFTLLAKPDEAAKLVAGALQGGRSADLTTEYLYPHGSAPALTDEEVRELHGALFDEAAARPWRTIPWKVSVAEALQLAERERKPVLKWESYGPPLTCG